MAPGGFWEGFRVVSGSWCRSGVGNVPNGGDVNAPDFQDPQKRRVAPRGGDLKNVPGTFVRSPHPHPPLIGGHIEIRDSMKALALLMTSRRLC